MILFIGLEGWKPSAALHFEGLAGSESNGLPYGWIGVLAALR